jgi:hypothetical protein
MAGNDQGGHERRWLTAPMAYAGLGVLTAVISFVFLVDPSLRPDPRDTQAATLQSVAFDQGISLRGYAERVGQGDSKQVTAYGQAACVPGNIVYLTESLQGFKSRHTTLRFLTLNALTHQRLRGAPTSVSGGGPVLEITSEVPSDQSVSLQWVQWPSNPGKYLIRFELFHGHSLLAIADTPPFTVTTSRYYKLFNRCEQLRRKRQPSEGAGFAEASIGGGGGGFDTARALFWIAVVGALGLLAALLVSGGIRLRNRLRDRSP